MSFPLGFFLLLLLAAFFAFGGLNALLYLLKIERCTLLLLILFCFASVFFSFTLPVNETFITINFSIILFSLLTLFLFFSKYFKISIRSIFFALLTAILFVLNNYAPFMADYNLILFAPYLFAPCAIGFLLLLIKNFRSGLQAILSGFLLSEIIMLFLQNGYEIQFGGVSSINLLYCVLVFYLMFYRLKIKFKGLSVYDIG